MSQEAIPVGYMLPYILRVDRNIIAITSVIFVPIIAYSAFYLAVTGPGNKIIGWTVLLACLIFLTVVYLGTISQKVQLSEDGLSYRNYWFVKKEMEYSSISEISFKYRIMRGNPIPFAELRTDYGESLLINLGPYRNGTKIWVLHDVLKRKAPQATMERSYEKIFQKPDDPDFGKTTLRSKTILGLLGILVLIGFIGGVSSGFIGGGISYLTSIPTYTPGHISTIEPSEMALQPSDIPGNFYVEYWDVRNASNTIPLAQSWGWKNGYSIQLVGSLASKQYGEQLVGLHASYGTIIRQGISVYPPDNITQVLSSFRYQDLVDEDNEILSVIPLQYPGIGDSSMATRITFRDDTSNDYMIDFVKKDVYEHIEVLGRTVDYENVENLAKIAAAKIQ